MSGNATTNETSNVTSLPSTPKAQTVKEVIAANVKLLIEQLEAGHSEGPTAYLTAMAAFIATLLESILEIARQRPSATSTPESAVEGVVCFAVAGVLAWRPHLLAELFALLLRRHLCPLRIGTLHPWKSHAR
jgi:hypothetical protein